jgi:hypothetical protein
LSQARTHYNQQTNKITVSGIKSSVAKNMLLNVARKMGRLNANNLRYIANQITYYTDTLAVDALVRVGMPGLVANGIVFTLL